MPAHMLEQVSVEFKKTLGSTMEESKCLNENDAFDKRMEVGRRELRLLEKGMGVGKRVEMSKEDLARIEEEAKAWEDEDEPTVGQDWPWER